MSSETTRQMVNSLLGLKADELAWWETDHGFMVEADPVQPNLARLHHRGCPHFQATVSCGGLGEFFLSDLVRAAARHQSRCPNSGGNVEGGSKAEPANSADVLRDTP